MLVPGPELLTANTSAHSGQLARRGIVTGVIGAGVPPEPAPGVRGSWKHDPALDGQYAVIAISPSTAVAVLARQTDGTESEFEFGVIHDRQRIICAARCLLRQARTSACTGLRARPDQRRWWPHGRNRQADVERNPVFYDGTLPPSRTTPGCSIRMVGVLSALSHSSAVRARTRVAGRRSVTARRGGRRQPSAHRAVADRPRMHDGRDGQHGGVLSAPKLSGMDLLPPGGRGLRRRCGAAPPGSARVVGPGAGANRASSA